MDILNSIELIIKENEELRDRIKRIIENIEINFEIINFCLNTIVPEKERQIFIDNYNHHSSDKYTRHLAFNLVQERKHGLKRIN